MASCSSCNGSSSLVDFIVGYRFLIKYVVDVALYVGDLWRCKIFGSWKRKTVAKQDSPLSFSVKDIMQIAFSG